VAELPEVDVAVVGGGPVGSALTLALSRSPVSVLQIAGEAMPTDRPIALSYGSRLILERLQAWQDLPRTPIETIHVSQKRGFGKTVIRCAEFGLPALGYVTSYSGLCARLPARADAGALAGSEPGDEHIHLRLARGAQGFGLRARLLVLAHGGAGEQALRTRDYRQHAIVAEVTAERPHCGTAWERFTPEGPLAMLPFRDRYAMVWSVRPESANELMALANGNFLARLRDAFGGRAGNFLEVGARAAFPLSLRSGKIDPAPRTLAVGNAAQTLHPVAGQGLNLGLRDAWEPAQMLLEARKHEIGSPEFLRSYIGRRQPDRRAGIGFTDFLVRTFSNSIAPIAAMRGAGLAALDMLPPARRFLARRMMFGARALP
jgi:2-octaprenyl-6-methoxyphenol hydroxylase